MSCGQVSHRCGFQKAVCERGDHTRPLLATGWDPEKGGRRFLFKAAVLHSVCHSLPRRGTRHATCRFFPIWEQTVARTCRERADRCLPDCARENPSAADCLEVRLLRGGGGGTIIPRARSDGGSGGGGRMANTPLLHSKLSLAQVLNSRTV